MNYKEEVLKLFTTNNEPKSFLSLFKYELKILFFISSLNSYKYDSLLRPFPNIFLENEKKKDFDKLKKICHNVPSLNKINSNSNLCEDTWKLIFWICTHNSINLEILNKKEANDLLDSLKLKNEKKVPDFIIRINSCSRARHNKLKEDNEVFKAFHGTKIENLHSIIHNGLLNNLNQRNVYGSGTYLSKDINVAINFSPYSRTTRDDLIYTSSGILLCDVINHPSVNVKINDTYILVEDDDLVNLTHLFLYTKIKKINKKPSFSIFEVLLIVFAIAVVLYSIYKVKAQ